MKTFIIKNKNIFLFLMGIGLLLFSWSLISYFLNQPILVPAPTATLREMQAIVLSPDFIKIVGITMLRFLLGFFITVLLSAIFGVLAGLSSSFAYVFSSFIGLMKAIPTMAMILLAIIWLKSDFAPILVVFLISFPVLYWSWKTGIEETDGKLLQMAAVYRIRPLRVLREIYLPSVKPYVLSGLSSALGLGFKVGIGAEVLCQPRFGIGTALQIEKSNLNTAGVFAWALICIVLVGLLDFLTKRFLFSALHRQAESAKSEKNSKIY